MKTQRLIGLLMLMVMSFIGCAGGSTSKVEYPIREVGEVKRLGVIEKLESMNVGLGEGDRLYCSGVWVRENEILTAAHCVRSDSVFSEWEGEVKIIRMEDIGKRSWVGYVRRVDKAKDLALIECNVPGDHSVAKLSRGYDGEEVISIGNPVGIGWVTLYGNVMRSSIFLNERLRMGGTNFSAMLVDIRAWKGNSGGGVFNKRGELLGIASHLFRMPGIVVYIGVDSIGEFLN